MSFNGSGTFVINSAGQPVVTGTVISSTAFNALTADLATGLSTTMTKDGQTTATANIPMGTFKFTGLGVGSAATDSANISQVQNSFGSFLTVAGTDTITATVSPSLTAYAAGQMFAFVAANTNTGAVTINISSLGAKAITKTGNTALTAGDLTANYLFVVVYDGTQFQVVGVSATTFTNLTISGVLTLSGANTQLLSTGTGAWKMPVGTTGQRPTGASGLIRLNSTTGNPEWYDTISASWLNFSQNSGYLISYLVVAGGGGGAEAGGGAGGLLASTTSLTVGTSYTVTVGAGGAGSISVTTTNGTSGSNSSFGASITATGGGGGGFTGAVGSNGGSGGGGGYQANYAGGTGVSGQGSAGGAGSNASNTSAGGGGGAGAVGGTASGSAAGNGGAGASNSISGTAVTYGGGGGGGGDNRGVTNGTGGSGGGGGGAFATAGTAGSANTGGGGGGGGFNNPTWSTGGAGGSGVVAISYAGTQRGTGGTVTTSGGNTIHTFTSSGTYTA